jgi:FKBP-type peptidyl-prolyl cis-trans isomerase
MPKTLPLLLAILLMASACAKPQPTAPASRTTPSGLGIIDLAEGSGPGAQTGDQVTVDYTGKLDDGTVFDASSKHQDGAFTFVLGTGQVIRGWNEGVVGMKVGGKRRLIVPSDLAYGEEGRPPVIGPNATLTFDIELHNISKPVPPDGMP